VIATIAILRTPITINVILHPLRVATLLRIKGIKESNPALTKKYVDLIQRNSYKEPQKSFVIIGDVIELRRIKIPKTPTVIEIRFDGNGSEFDGTISVPQLLQCLKFRLSSAPQF